MIWLALFAIIVAAILFSKLITSKTFWQVIGVLGIGAVVLPHISEAKSGEIGVLLAIVLGVVVLAVRRGRLNL